MSGSLAQDALPRSTDRYECVSSPVVTSKGEEIHRNHSVSDRTRMQVSLRPTEFTTNFGSCERTDVQPSAIEQYVKIHTIAAVFANVRIRTTERALTYYWRVFVTENFPDDVVKATRACVSTFMVHGPLLHHVNKNAPQRSDRRSEKLPITNKDHDGLVAIICVRS